MILCLVSGMHTEMYVLTNVQEFVMAQFDVIFEGSPPLQKYILDGKKLLKELFLLKLKSGALMK